MMNNILLNKHDKPPKNHNTVPFKFDYSISTGIRDKYICMLCFKKKKDLINFDDKNDDCLKCL